MMTPGDLIDILGGKLPEATKEDLRLAAKRIHDRKRYALKTNLNWTQDDTKPPEPEPSPTRLYNR